MSRRIQIVLPDTTASQLDQLAAALGTRTATLAGQLVRENIETLTGKPRTPQPPTPNTEEERPPWLEPYGGDSEWRALMWGAVVALYGRYPQELQNVKTGWWKDPSTAERLCALAVWRDQIDDNATDPREEIAFHNDLEHFTTILHKHGFASEDTWKPGAPPRTGTLTQVRRLSSAIPYLTGTGKGLN
jgi:hypothetical protein